MRKRQEITDDTRRKNLITEVSIFTGAFLFFGMHWGVVYREMKAEAAEGQSIFLDSMNGALEHIASHPFRILPAEPSCVLVAAFGAVIVGIYLYSQYLRVKGTTAHAHGDATFETRYDLYDREFVFDPAVIAANLSGQRGQLLRPSLSLRTQEQSPCPSVEAITTFNEEHKRVVRGKYLRGKGSVLDECRRQSQIYTDRISLSLNGKWTQRNTNAIVFGGSGTGKSRFFLEPNILQGNSSIIVTDPSGDVLAVTGDFLEKVMHYKVKVFNINDMTKSCRFNPLHYIRDEKDIPKIVNVLMENTQTKKSSGGDADFWDKTTRALLCAAIGYLYEVCPPEQRNFANVLELIRMDDLQSLSPDNPETGFDQMFKALGEADPNSYAFKQYLTYKEAPVNTALSIQISTSVLLSQFFDIDEFKNLTFKDEMELDRIGEEPTALFLQIPQADTTYAWVTAMLFSLVLKELFAQGEERMAREGLGAPELAVPVRLMIDEAANIGKIPDLEKFLATCRKYRLSIVPIFQNYSQVVNLYGRDTANDIVSNCDAFLFLGGVDADTLKIVVERCGKETVQTISQTMAVSGRGSNSESKSQAGRDLVSRIQAEQMANDTCLLFIRGLSPFKTKKYRLERHPNYKYMAEAEGSIYENPYRLVYEDEAIEEVRVKAIYEEGYAAPVIKDSARRRAMILGMALELKEMRETRQKLYDQHEAAQIKGNEPTAIRLENKIKEVEKMIEHYEKVPGVADVNVVGTAGAVPRPPCRTPDQSPVPMDFEILGEGEALAGCEVTEVNTVLGA